MSDTGIASLIGIFGGVILGFGLGIVYEKYTRQVAEDKIRRQRVEEAVAKVGKKDKEEPSQETESVQDPIAAEKELLRSDLEESDYHNYAAPEEEKKYDKSEDFDLISVTFPGDPDYPKDREESDEDDYGEWLPDDEDGLEDVPDGPSVETLEELYLETKQPHQIEPGEFELNEFKYDQETWTYHEPDDIVVDFCNQRIKPEHLKEHFTDDAFEILRNSHDDTSVFWRSPLHRTEIELVVDKTPFSESVGGFRESKQQEIAERRRKKQNGKA